jgi:hypothetical protein
VTATERRSQHENKAHALDRLREAIAVGVRCPPPTPVHWPQAVHIQDRRLTVSPKNTAYWQVLALVLDQVQSASGEMPVAAARLAVTASSLTRFLAAQPKAWIEANRIRKNAGLPALRA